MSLGGQGALVFTVILYQRYMREWETRSVVYLNYIFVITHSFASLALTLQWNEVIGISNIVFVALTGSTIFPIIIALHMLPPFVLIAKITPAHVEATIFSFAASVLNIGIHFGAKYMGLFWNKLFFNINTDNLDEFWKLCLVELCLAFVCLLYVPILPTWEEVRIQQEHLKELNEAADNEIDSESDEPSKKGALLKKSSTLETTADPSTPMLGVQASV